MEYERRPRIVKAMETASLMLSSYQKDCLFHSFLPLYIAASDPLGP